MTTRQITIEQDNDKLVELVKDVEEAQNTFSMAETASDREAAYVNLQDAQRQLALHVVSWVNAGYRMSLEA